VNGVLVNSKSVGEIQQMLDDCTNRLVVEVIRCRGMTATSSDMSQCSSLPTQSSAPTTDEFDPSSTTDLRSRRKARSGLLQADPAGALCKSEKSPTERVNASEPSMMSIRGSCSHLGHNRENKQNFLDKAVNALRRPFLRSKQSRATRDARSKSAVGSPNTAVDDFAVSGGGQGVSSAAGPHCPESAAHKEQSLSRQKLSESGHGTWPKRRAHAAQRPSALHLYTFKPSSSTDEEGPSLPKPTEHGLETRRTESARHHRTQISDSVVDYDSHVISQKSIPGPEETPQSSANCKSLYAADSFMPVGPHYAKQFPDQSNETTVTVRSRLPAEHHVTVISHFPVEHCDGEMISYEDQAKYTQRPISHTSPFSSAEKQLLNSSGVIVSSLPSRTEQPTPARYASF